VAVVVFFAIAMLFFAAQVVVYVRRVSSSVGMFRFLRDQLHLKDSDIRSLHWSEVVDALMRFQQRHPISLRKPVLDVLGACATPRLARRAPRAHSVSPSLRHQQPRAAL
jgi:hypothetical protein